MPKELEKLRDWKERIEDLRPKVSNFGGSEQELAKKELQRILDLYWGDLQPHLIKFIEMTFQERDKLLVENTLTKLLAECEFEKDAKGCRHKIKEYLLANIEPK